MPKQKGISKNMRALLVDWLAEIQENFELNHETLYLAVKIIDIYLSKVIITRDQLQLLGATAMLISCKYDVSATVFIYFVSLDFKLVLEDFLKNVCF